MGIPIAGVRWNPSSLRRPACGAIAIASTCRADRRGHRRDRGCRGGGAAQRSRSGRIGAGVALGQRLPRHDDAHDAITVGHLRREEHTHRIHNIYKAITSNKLAPQVRNDPEYVYVPNGDPGTVEVIDPSTYKVIRRFSLGFHSCRQHVAPSYDLRWLYPDVDGANALAKIDPPTGKLVRLIHGIERPYNLYFTPDGARAIDVAEYDNTLIFMNPRTWKPIKDVKMPCNGSDHADFGPPGTSYLLISCENEGHIIKVEWKTMRVLRVLNVGGMPIDVKLTPDGTHFLVANQGLGGVSVIDPKKMKQVGFIPTARGAHGMALSRDTTHMSVTDRLAGEISLIDLKTLTVTATWNVGGSPDMAQVSPDGSELWVTNRFGTTVSVISTKTGKVLHHIEVGPDPLRLS